MNQDTDILSDLAFVISVHGKVHPQSNLEMARRAYSEIHHLRAALAEAERRVAEQSARIAELYLAQKSRFLSAKLAASAEPER